MTATFSLLCLHHHRQLQSVCNQEPYSQLPSENQIRCSFAHNVFCILQQINEFNISIRHQTTKKNELEKTTAIQACQHHI